MSPSVKLGRSQRSVCSRRFRWKLFWQDILDPAGLCVPSGSCPTEVADISASRAGYVHPPASSPSAIPRLTRMSFVLAGSSSYLPQAEPACHYSRSGVQRHRHRMLLGPWVGDEESQIEPLGILSEAQDRHEFSINVLGDDESLFEGHPARHPVELQELSDSGGILRKPQAHVCAFPCRRGCIARRGLHRAGLSRTA
jgi:hypothetical protein